MVDCHVLSAFPSPLFMLFVVAVLSARWTVGWEETMLYFAIPPKTHPLAHTNKERERRKHAIHSYLFVRIGWNEAIARDDDDDDFGPPFPLVSIALLPRPSHIPSYPIPPVNFITQKGTCKLVFLARLQKVQGLLFDSR